jgi:hypothetical protein
MLWRNVLSLGALLIDIAISPTPKAQSILNWPHRKFIDGGSSGSSTSVVMSFVSAMRSTTRCSIGVKTSRFSRGATCEGLVESVRSLDTMISVEVE